MVFVLRPIQVHRRRKNPLSWEQSQVLDYNPVQIVRRYLNQDEKSASPCEHAVPVGDEDLLLWVEGLVWQAWDDLTEGHQGAVDVSSFLWVPWQETKPTKFNPLCMKKKMNQACPKRHLQLTLPKSKSHKSNNHLSRTLFQVLFSLFLLF